MFRRLSAALAGFALALTGAGLVAAPAGATDAVVSEVAAGPAVITGTFVDAKGKAVRAEVIVHDRSDGRYLGAATSDAKGRFTVAVEAEGLVSLSFPRETWPKPDAWGTTIKAVATPGATTSVGTVRLARPTLPAWGTAELRLVVSGAIPGGYEEDDYGVPVHLKDSRGRFVAEGTVQGGEDGNPEFSVGNLKPGRYRFYVPATGQTIAVTAKKGRTTTARLRLVKPKKRGSLTIKAVEADGSRAWQVFELINARGLVAARGETSQGYDTVRDLPVGRYTVSMTTDEGVPYARSATVAHGRTKTATTRLRPTGGTLHGTVRDSAGGYQSLVILKGVGSSARYETWADADGSFTFQNVKPGRYRAMAVDATGPTGARYTVGGYAHAYYRGTKASDSRVFKIRKDRTTRMGAIVFAG